MSAFDRLQREINKLGESNKLEINGHGWVFKTHRDQNGKKHSARLFNLFQYVEELIPLKSNMWSPSGSGLVSFSGFGQKSQPYDGLTAELIAVLSAFEFGLELSGGVELGMLTDTFGHKYNRVQVGSLIGYYSVSLDRLLKITDHNGKEYSIPAEYIPTGKRTEVKISE